MHGCVPGRGGGGGARCGGGGVFDVSLVVVGHLFATVLVMSPFKPHCTTPPHTFSHFSLLWVQMITAHSFGCRGSAYLTLLGAGDQHTSLFWVQGITPHSFRCRGSHLTLWGAGDRTSLFWVQGITPHSFGCRGSHLTPMRACRA